MELNKNAQIDTDQVSDVGSSRAGGGGGGFGGIPIPGGAGGGVVGLIVLVLVVVGGLIGGKSLLGDNSGTGTETPVSCPTSDPNRFNDVKCRDALYVNSIQAYWQTTLPVSGGVAYEKSDTTFFSQAVSTGCGQADSGVGPFYCPEDNTIYIDLSFWDQLSSRFGAKGEFAQPYVLAHEYGHHVQDLDGTEAEVRRQMERDPNNQNAYSVKLELQADCYAGAWAKHATETTDKGGQPLFVSISQQDINDALEAAAAVGDDAIQKKMGGRVDESQFTHGSSADRQKWFTAGFSSGDPKACNTFGN